MDEISKRIEQLSPAKRALLELNAKKLAQSVEPARAPIAIIGLSCRFPGGADDPEAFWQALREGRDLIGEVPPGRWDADAIYDPEPGTPGRVNTRRGGFLREVDMFDPQFFDISPREAASMDPQQRLLLEVSWEALERAGQPMEQLAGSATGVFVGLSTSDYAQVLRESHGLEGLDVFYVSGNAWSIAAGRLAYTLGLQGPAMAIDTACSSSLTAVHLAIQSLRSGETRMALAGGVNLMLHPASTVVTAQLRLIAPDGRCKTFDASADGYVRGEGCGMVVLKRLADALADGDDVLAVIRGIASNQDGRSAGITAPNGPAQEAVIRRALADACVEPRLIGYVEAHGTGTALGDPIEVQALAAVLGGHQPPGKPLMIGSVKTNVGHLEAAAGIAGLIKLVLALQHREIPPHLHLNTVSPSVPINRIPASIPTAITPWPERDGRRIGGLSSFGFSGTNVHLVLEEGPSRTSSRSTLDATAGRPHSARSAEPVSQGSPPLSRLLALSARQPEALRALTQRYVRWLETHPDAPLADICHTANTGRMHFEYRLAAVADSARGLETSLRTLLLEGLPDGSIAPGRVAKPGGVAFLFTGQGAACTGMGRQLYQAQPVFRDTIDRCARLLGASSGISLLELLYSPEAGLPIEDTAAAQPALLAIELALAELWRSWGIEPAAIMGHSVGEYAAACVAGVFSLEECLSLVTERGRLMQSLPSGGGMATVFAAADEVGETLVSTRSGISVAAINGPNNTVISGDEVAIRQALDIAAGQGWLTRRLYVSHAFHSSLMEPVIEPFERFARRIEYAAPRFPLISSVSGQMFEPGQVPDAAYWVRHLRMPVAFQRGMASLTARGLRTFLEIGPSPVLLELGKRCDPDPECRWLASLLPGTPDMRVMLESLGTLYREGRAVSFAHIDPEGSSGRIALPTYPYQRKSYWVTGPAARPVHSEDVEVRHETARPNRHGLAGSVAGLSQNAFVDVLDTVAEAPARELEGRTARNDRNAPRIPRDLFVEVLDNT